ncbi:acetyl-CoA carboxylase biotin carboxyl carrier protein [Clostridium sp. chh4-2]|uniref:acetyl-CoA carboxylase biotin carboxyl carrier protein n=1 Tax=Clostridium sp. chh4-2 TaxID=2067550 RepID=UPI000CCF2DDE|nr:acetyl-CoA carboxylase biotin carboxyl carrier protein [Clostridium sp. chh4-2]PNV60363.1 acetyl-CoA carboxylase biotin carboxyl carrier protein [Clostridium sp. chh4-2]
MTINEITKLIQAVSDNGLSSFEYQQGDEKLILKKKKNVPQAPAPVVFSQAPAPMMAAPAMPMAAPAVSMPVETEEEKQETVLIGSDNVVVSPLVGTFYNAASPDSEPFVKVGDVVKKGQVLGIIEAMKLMNEIESEFDGVVEAILVNNEDVVEYGQPLFRIR